MPIYEYQCENCPDRFEIKQGMKDDPLTACPRCGKRVQRLISSPAIMFKGSGWYVTDYARAKTEEKSSSGSEKTESRSEKAERVEKAADEKASAKPESKPAEKKKEGKEKKAAKE